MSEARLEQSGAGQYRVTGALTFDTVPQMFQRGCQLLAGNSDVALDLAGVERSDSAGLALLVSWVRQVRRRNGAVVFLNVPDQLLGLARVGGVAQILAFEA